MKNSTVQHDASKPSSADDATRGKILVLPGVDRPDLAAGEPAFELSPRMKWLLILFGTALGIGFGVLVGFIVRRELQPAMPEGSSFENLNDFRTALKQRDSRDVKAEGNVSLRSIMVSDDSDQIIYRLAPNLNVTFQGVPVRTNSFGMRGPERAMAKPPGVYRIALMGDSFTFGWGVEEDKIFATRLEEMLNQSGGVQAKKVEVLNFGVPGYSTFQEAALFQQFGTKFEPDAVLVFFIDNDFGLPFFIKNFGSVTNEMITGTSFNRTNEGEDPQVQQKRAELIALLDANQALRRLADTCKAKGIPLYLAINPGKSAPAMADRLVVLKERPDIRHLWLRDDMLSRIEKDKINPRVLTLRGDPHPSALKHNLLAEFLTAKLRAYPEMK